MGNNNRSDRNPNMYLFTACCGVAVRKSMHLISCLYHQSVRTTLVFPLKYRSCLGCLTIPPSKNFWATLHVNMCTNSGIIQYTVCDWPKYVPKMPMYLEYHSGRQRALMTSPSSPLSHKKSWSHLTSTGFELCHSWQQSYLRQTLALCTVQAVMTATLQ